MYSIDNYKRSLRLVVSDREISVYEYCPSVFKLFAIPLEKQSVVRRVRLLLELIRGGYKVYYIAKEGNVVGYCVVTPGGRRLKCTTRQDVVIGPYYICPEHRGKGLSKILISLLLEHCLEEYDAVYDWIYKDNIPSIRCMEACGFTPIGKLDVVGISRRLIMNPQGSYFIYRKVLDDNQISLNFFRQYHPNVTTDNRFYKQTPPEISGGVCVFSGWLRECSLEV